MLLISSYDMDLIFQGSPCSCQLSFLLSMNFFKTKIVLHKFSLVSFATSFPLPAAPQISPHLCNWVFTFVKCKDNYHAESSVHDSVIATAATAIATLHCPLIINTIYHPSLLSKIVWISSSHILKEFFYLIISKSKNKQKEDDNGEHCPLFFHWSL